jgi:hypothetical protein
LGPRSEVILLWRADCREVLVLPVLEALTLSVTSIVTRSSTRLARKSRAISFSRAEELHSDPGDPPFCEGCVDRDIASLTYCSSGEISFGFGGVLSFAAKPEAASNSIDRRIRILIRFYSTATQPSRITRARKLLPLSKFRTSIEFPMRPGASARTWYLSEAAP